MFLHVSAYNQQKLEPELRIRNKMQVKRNVLVWINSRKSRVTVLKAQRGPASQKNPLPFCVPSFAK